MIQASYAKYSKSSRDRRTNSAAAGLRNPGFALHLRELVDQYRPSFTA